MSARVLKFIVDGQSLTLDPSCNFEGLVPGTDKYLKAEFKFSSAWDKCTKVATFYSALGVEYNPVILVNDQCTIPAEALTKRVVKVQVRGKAPEYSITTNKVEFVQNGG